MAVALTVFTGALKAVVTGMTVRQLAGTRSGSPIITLQVQLIGVALLSVEFSEGLSSITGSGVALVSFVLRLMRPSTAIVICATYWLTSPAGL